MQPEFSLQNNVNTISEDKSELLNNNAVVVDRAERSSTKNDLLINSLLDVSSKEMEINTEIVNREYEAMRKTGWFVPYTKNPESFRSWIKERCTAKVVALCVISSLVPWLFSFFYSIKFDNSYFIIAVIYICSSMIFWIYLSDIFMNVGAKGLFKKFNIKIEAKEKKDLANILALFSVFLNNYVIDFTKEEKKETLEKVVLFFSQSRREKINDLLNDIIFKIDKEKFNLNEFGLRNSKEAKQILNNEVSYRNLQNELLQCASHGNLLKIDNDNNNNDEDSFKDGFIKGLVKKEIDQDKVDYFTDDFFKRFEKLSFFKGSTLYGELFIPIMSIIMCLLIFFYFIVSATNFTLGLITLPLILIIIPPFFVAILLNRGSKIFNSYGISQNKIDINVIAKKTALLSLILKSEGNDFTEKDKENILNKYIDSVFYLSSFSFKDKLFKVEKQRIKYLKDKELEDKKIMRETSTEEKLKKNELLSFDLDTLNNDDDFQYLSIESRKNILFNK